MHYKNYPYFIVKKTAKRCLKMIIPNLWLINLTKQSMESIEIVVTL